MDPEGQCVHVVVAVLVDLLVDVPRPHAQRSHTNFEGNQWGDFPALRSATWERGRPKLRYLITRPELLRVRGFERGGWGRDRADVGALQSSKWVGSLVGGTRPPGCSKVQCGPPKKVRLWVVRGCWGGQQRSIVPKMGSLVGGTRPPGRSTVSHIIPKWVPLSLVRGRRGIPQCSVVPRAGSLIGGTQPPGCSAVQYSPPSGFLYGWYGAAGALHCNKMP